MSRIKIVHVTTLEYVEEATASYNEVRMLPQTRDGQYVMEETVRTSPGGAQHSYVDFWGTLVSAFEVLIPHHALTVTATSVIDVHAQVADVTSYAWSDLAEDLPRSLELADALTHTQATLPDDDMSALAARVRAAEQNIDAAAQRICYEVGEAMEYRRGVTAVNSTAREAWKKKSGVCQDIAHVSLGVLREAGIPARYVSGYLHPDAHAPLGTAVVGESHAWVEWFAGRWRGFDPTNLCDIGDSHVYVGHGRDYSDVAPLRGVYAGKSGSELSVRVELTRLG